MANSNNPFASSGRGLPGASFHFHGPSQQYVTVFGSPGEYTVRLNCGAPAAVAAPTPPRSSGYDSRGDVTITPGSQQIGSPVAGMQAKSQDTPTAGSTTAYFKGFN